jgi:hypothetical protein
VPPLLRSLLSATTAVVVAVSGSLAGPTRGDPEPEPDPYITVEWMRCGERRSGELAFSGFTPTDSPDLYLLSAVARLSPCRPPTEAEIWGIAAYRATGRDRVETVAAVWYSRMLEGETTITGTMAITRGVRAVCLVAASNVRLKCTRINWPSPTAGPVIGAGLRTNARLVRAPAPLPLVPRFGPGCPVCWN